MVMAVVVHDSSNDESGVVADQPFEQPHPPQHDASPDFAAAAPCPESNSALHDCAQK
jgi:hypothetical protein